MVTIHLQSVTDRVPSSNVQSTESKNKLQSISKPRDISITFTLSKTVGTT